MLGFFFTNEIVQKTNSRETYPQTLFAKSRPVAEFMQSRAQMAHPPIRYSVLHRILNNIESNSLLILFIANTDTFACKMECLYLETEIL